jgi:hypothetical protein
VQHRFCFENGVWTKLPAGVILFKRGRADEKVDLGSDFARFVAAGYLVGNLGQYGTGSN